MKTIIWQDKASGTMYQFNRPDLKRNERIKQALIELRHLGNCLIYLQDGNKLKPINNKGL